MKELNYRYYLFVNQAVGYFTLNSKLQDVSSHPKQLKELKMKQLVRHFPFLTTMSPMVNVKNKQWPFS